MSLSVPAAVHCLAKHRRQPIAAQLFVSCFHSLLTPFSAKKTMVLRTLYSVWGAGCLW